MNSLAKFAIQNRKNLMKGNDSFAALTLLFDSLTEEQKENQKVNLAKLYLAMFKPEKENKRELSIMQSLAKFSAKNDIRYYLNYIHITAEGFGVSSTGHILLITKNKTDLEPGFYDPKSKLLVENIDFAKFPDFENIFKNINSLKDYDILEPTEIKLEKPTKGKPYENYKIGGYFYISDYLKLAYSVMNKSTANIGNNGQLLIENDDFKCIVMPRND
jgi:hypothetical protein